MKILTNILTRLMLMLLLFASCIEDVAEVDNLVQQEEYVSVRINVPGMKSAATRATAEDNITSIVALVFREGALISQTEVTTAASTLIPTTTTTGSFKIEMPKSGDVIHFLANLPNDYDLSGIDEMSDLTSLTTGERENLSYWGMATYSSGETLDVTLYRNMAMIEIAAGPDCTFPEDQLFIAGLINANQRGALVPDFGFDLNTDEPTLPAEQNLETDEEAQSFVSSLYVFEHANPGTPAGLYVICKIGKYYYKVALTDGKDPYKIIRNHKYVIYVNDLDEGVRDYDAALTADPINFEVVEMKNVTLTLTPKTETLTYGETSEEQVTVTVGGINNAVESLTLTAPGFSILTDYATLQDGKYILDDGISQIDFTLTLTDPSQAGTISVTGAGEYVNSINTPSTTIALTQREEVNGEIVMWQGAVAMHNNPNDGTTHAGKVLIPYSFFFDAEGNQQILVDSKIRLEYNGSGYIQTYLFIDNEPSIWNISESTELTLTQDLLDRIKQSHTKVWGVDAAFMFEGGGGAVLNKVTLIPAKERITATADKTQLYYDSEGDAQIVTISVTVPDGVETLTIGGASNFTVTKSAGDGALNGTTYTLGSERTATFVFTLNAQNVTEPQTITFSGENVESASVTINMMATPTVTFENTGAQTITLGSPLTVTMTVPDGKSLTEFSIAVVSEADVTGFAVVQDETPLTLTEGVYTTSGVSGTQTFTFTPAAIGTYTITFSGSGEDVRVPNTSINVTVGETKPSKIVIWKNTGNSDYTVNYYPGLTLQYEGLLEKYKGQTMKARIKVSKDSYSTILFKNGDNQFYQASTNDVLKQEQEMILDDITIPSELNNNVIIYGSGVILYEIYIE